MRREVEFGDEVFERKLVLGYLEFFGIIPDPLEQFDGPTTSNIVRDLDLLDLLVFQS